MYASKFYYVTQDCGRNLKSNLAETIDVDDSAEVVQLIVAGKGHGLPYVALHALAVTHEAVSSIASLVVMLAAVGHSARDREALKVMI